MMSRALTGTTEGTFDTLLVRSPADTGAYQNILSLIDTASSSPTYDDTALYAALDNKVDDAQVLTNVPAGAVFSMLVLVHFHWNLVRTACVISP